MRNLTCQIEKRPAGRHYNAWWILGALLTAAGIQMEAKPPADAGPIPERPEKLVFAPLDYQTPRPEDYRVVLAEGPVAYIVPDRELPLVNIVVFVKTGSYLVPTGKEGLSDLTGYLLARGGTASKSAEALEEELDFLAADLNSGVSETHGTVSLNLLAKDLDKGFQILREVLTAPRFQEDKLALRKEQLMQELRQRNDDARNIEARERRFLGFGERFWANRLPTAKSLEGIERSDLAGFHRRWFHPSNFVVAVNGDFSAEEMKDRLGRLFADWPYRGEMAGAVPADAEFARPGVYLVNKDVNQGRVSILLPGVRRENPDYFAITVMNEILGAGGFTSRIMNRVRSDEGLAYSASSHFPGGVYFPSIFTASFQSKSRTVAYAASIVIEEMQKMSESEVTDQEMETAKKSFIDSFPRRFATKSRVATVFAEDELTGQYARDPGYWAEYRTRISKITKLDVLRVARKYLTQDKLVILAVGNSSDMLQGHPDHAISLKSLAGDRVVELPLRDPLTLEPVRGKD